MANRELYDINATMNVLSYLMNNPQTITRDSCLLTANDFTKTIHQIVFSAIYNIAYDGSRQIREQDIDMYLNQYEEQHRIYIENSGREYVKQLEELDVNDEALFNSWYNKVKKLTVLRDLERNKIDTLEFYNPTNNFLNKDEEEQKLNDISIPQILDRIRLKLANIEKVNFNKDGNYFQSADKGVDDLLNRLDNEPDIGLPMVGAMLNYVCRGGRRGKMYLYSAGSGGGKALPNDTVIPMADGSWKTVKEVQVGDYLLDRTGKPTKVEGIFPQGLKDVYCITFKDGRRALCNDEHLWAVHNVSAKNYYRLEIKTLRDIIDSMDSTCRTLKGQYKYSIPVNQPIEYKTKEYKIDPYILGLLIGDGCLREQPDNRNLTFSDGEEILVKNFESLGWTYKRSSLNNYTYSFKKDGKNIHVKEFCEEYNLMSIYNTYTEEKNIPEEFLYGDIQQRFDLLNGLLDTDGSVDEKGRVAFFTINKYLMQQVVQLIRSLGLIATIQEDKRPEKYTTNVCFTVHITGRPELKRKLFRMRRKHERIENWYNNEKRKEHGIYNAITNIEKLEYQTEMTCFIVDNPEHLFLMNDYIVTHNTRFFMMNACARALPHMEYIDGKWQLVYPKEQERVYFISVEQEPEELQTMVLAYISGVEEHKMLWQTWSPEERERVHQAAKVLKEYGDYLYIDRIPEPSILKVRSTMVEKILEKNIDMVVYDYIAIPEDDGTAAKRQLRSDQVLMQFSAMLKEVAVSYNVFMLTGTQITGSDPRAKMVRGFADIRDGKSIADKADFCMIGCEVTDEEYGHIETYCKEIGIERPTQVIDVYKNRSGVHKNCKIYRDTNLGNLQAKDLLITTQSFKLINDCGEINYGSQKTVDVLDFLTRGEQKC